MHASCCILALACLFTISFKCGFFNPGPLSCVELREDSPHVSCCLVDTEFCPIQCNNEVCRCVDPITGNVVGSGLFFDEGNTEIDCVESKGRERERERVLQIDDF